MGLQRIVNVIKISQICSNDIVINFKMTYEGCQINRNFWNIMNIPHLYCWIYFNWDVDSSILQQTPTCPKTAFFWVCHSQKRSLLYCLPYLEILGVPKTASHSEIKKAYYKLAQTHHPDKNESPEAKEKFT